MGRRRGNNQCRQGTGSWRARDRFKWTYALTVPPTGDENVRLNLWLSNRVASTDNQEVEVIISSFQFMPLGTPQPALLTLPASVSANPFRFALHGEFDRW